MSFGSGFAVYFIMWWVSLFVVLPFGVKSQHETGEIAPGSDPGAPTHVRIGRIALATSLVALVPFLIFQYVIVPNF